MSFYTSDQVRWCSGNDQTIVVVVTLFILCGYKWLRWQF